MLHKAFFRSSSRHPIAATSSRRWPVSINSRIVALWSPGPAVADQIALSSSANSTRSRVVSGRFAVSTTGLCSASPSSIAQVKKRDSRAGTVARDCAGFDFKLREPLCDQLPVDFGDGEVVTWLPLREQKAFGLRARALLLILVDVARNVELNERGERCTRIGLLGSHLSAEILTQFRLGQNLAGFGTSLARREQCDLAESDDTLPAADAVPTHPGTRA